MELQDNKPEIPYFRVRPLDQVIKDGNEKPDKKKICGAFLYQDTTTFLFSRTNYGKSLLAFQFAYAAATGTDFDPCEAFKNNCDPMLVLMADLEMEDKDIAVRHQKIIEKDKNPFISNLLFLHEKIENKMLVGFHLLEEIEKAVVDNKPGLLIIDNISKLLPDAIKGDTVTEMITVLNRIRQATQCSIFVIGHTIKGNPKICIQPTDYYGSSMMQNFFAEFYFLDRTREGNYFLCHTKTKHKEEYIDSVPILTRGEHEKFGLGFRYQAIQAIDQVQLPISLQPPSKARSRNLQKFEKEIKLLLSSGCTQRQVAELCNCSQASISKLMDD